MVFHGTPRWSAHEHHPHESPWVVTGPLIALAVPSVLLGIFMIGPFVFGEVMVGPITVLPSHTSMQGLRELFNGPLGLTLHSLQTPAFWLMLAGLLAAYVLYIVRTQWPAAIQKSFGWLHTLWMEKYYLDRFNLWFFAGGARRLGSSLWAKADQGVIDGFFVNGSARLVASVAGVLRLGQTGFLYHYAIAMILGVALLLWWFAPLALDAGLG